MFIPLETLEDIKLDIADNGILISLPCSSNPNISKFKFGLLFSGLLFALPMSVLCYIILLQIYFIFAMLTS